MTTHDAEKKSAPAQVDPSDSKISSPAVPTSEQILRTRRFRSSTLKAASALALLTIVLIVLIWRRPGNGFYPTLVISVTGVAAVLFFLWKIPKWQVEPYRSSLEAKDRVSLEIQARSTLIQIIGGIAVVASVYLTAQNLQLTAESVKTAQSSAESASRLARLTQITERYATAVQQLESPNIEMRLAGIYALDILAGQEASADFHRPIMLVLASHVRSGSPLKLATSEDSTSPSGPIGADIQAILTVLGRQNKDGEEGTIDLHGTYLRNADMHAGQFKKVNFSGCLLAGSNFVAAHLEEADLSDTDLTETHFDGAFMASVKMEGAHLIGTTLKNAHLQGAKLNLAELNEAVCDDAELIEVDFSHTRATGGWFNGSDFSRSTGLDEAWINFLKENGRTSDRTKFP